jgi:hypothetical protein
MMGRGGREGKGGIQAMANVMRLPNVTSRQKWVELISNAWREQLPSIFETGNLLEAAKLELTEQKGHGEWLRMVKEELPFGKRTAQMLMKIAGNDNLREAKHASLLPASWMTLHELTHLTSDQFAAGIKSGLINPKMERKHVNELRGIKPKAHKKKEVKPLTLDEWCFSFSEQITDAFASLKKPDTQELLEHLKGIIVALEETNGR